MSVVGTIFAALYVGHLLGDHWAQTGWQAANKGQPGWTGRRACAGHVASHTAITALILAAVCAATGWWPDPVDAAAGLGVGAVTHYWADRRAPLIRLARRLGKGGYLDGCTVVRTPGGPAAEHGPGTGLLHLDQSFHIAWLLGSALIIGGF